MQIHNIEQRSDEWYELRKKYPLTASNAQAIGNNGRGLETLIWNVLADKYSTAEKENYSNKDLERGVELEPQARAMYELERGVKVEEVGFVTNEDISKVAGASPDGTVGTDGLIEIKCFDDAKHFKYSINGLEVESQYMWQMQMQLLITGRKWVDYVAYNPDFKSSLLIVRVEPDKEMQEKIVEGLKKGEQIIKEIEAKIN
jgi:putative phage-type endonuclease